MSKFFIVFGDRFAEKIEVAPEGLAPDQENLNVS